MAGRSNASAATGDDFEIIDLSRIRRDTGWINQLLGDVSGRSAAQQVAIGGASGWYVVSFYARFKKRGASIAFHISVGMTVNMSVSPKLVQPIIGECLTQIVQRIIVKKWLDRSLFDKSMKFGIVVVYSITKDISYDAKLNRSKI